MPNGFPNSSGVRSSAAANAGTVRFPVYNGTGATLTKGTVVHDLFATTDVIQVEALGTNQPGPVLGVLAADIPNNANGTCVGAGGTVTGINTSSFTLGDQLYVSASTAGLLTNSAPNSLTDYVHAVAYVNVVNATNGTITVLPYEDSPRQHAHTGDGEGGNLLSPHFVEFAAASISTPPSGQQALFIDSADHKLKRKDSSGTVTIIG